MQSLPDTEAALAAARAFVLVGKPDAAAAALDGLGADDAPGAIERGWIGALRFAEPTMLVRALPSVAAGSIAGVRRATLLGVLANRSGEPDRALTYLHEAMRGADALDDMAARIDVWLEFARVFTWTGGDAAAFMHLSDALSEASALNDAARTFLVLTRFGDLHLELQRHERALQYFQRARAYDADHVGGVFWLRLHLDQARAELGAGNLDGALAQADAFLADHAARCPPYLSFLADRVRTLALVRLGRGEEAEAALDELRAAATASGGAYENNEVQLAEAELMIATGRHGEAEAILRTMLPRYEGPDNAVPAIQIRLMLAEAYAGLDQRSRSTRVLASGIEYAGKRDLKTQVQRLRTTQTRLGLFDAVPEEHDRHFAEPGERSGGGYVLLERAGQGGFGTVYRALDMQRNREVAIKRFRLTNLYSRGRRENIIASIKNELDATAELSHPGIARTIACGREDNGEYYVVQEFVHGPSLRSLMHGAGIDTGLALEIARDAALALEALHAVGVRHRDIKPDNILLRRGRHPVLVDFGIATRGRSGTRPRVAGTRAYMPPETLLGYPDRGRGDVYGLAVVLFEVLGGRLPPDVETLSYLPLVRRHRALLAAIAELRIEGPLPAAAIRALLRAAIRYPLARPALDAAHFAQSISVVLGADGPQ